MSKPKVLGLVLELNPFHNGHHYFIQEAKRKIEPDVTIAVISSSFSMRGDAMVMDKWQKAKFCLNYGIDMVLELPFLGSVTSSDYFCFNAISTLVKIGITDLAFGVETCDLTKLQTMKNLVQSSEFDLLVQDFLSKGHSYSASSYKAIQALSEDKDIQAGFTLPNNTLAIGYLKALDQLHPSVNVTLIERLHNQYYDQEVSDTRFSSATSLRLLLDQQIPIDKHTPIDDYTYFVPQEMNKNLFLLLQYVLATTPLTELASYWGMNEGLERRFVSMMDKATTYEEFVELVQTRRYTTNRIQRTILYLLLKIPKTYERKPHSYLRILSMNSIGKKYINQCSKEIKQAILTSFKNRSEDLVEIELRASKLYGIITNQPNLYYQEFNVPFTGE